jgi:hypothetical protein
MPGAPGPDFWTWESTNPKCEITRSEISSAFASSRSRTFFEWCTRRLSRIVLPPNEVLGDDASEFEIRHALSCAGPWFHFSGEKMLARLADRRSRLSGFSEPSFMTRGLCGNPTHHESDDTCASSSFEIGNASSERIPGRRENSLCGTAPAKLKVHGKRGLDVTRPTALKMGVFLD